MKKVFIILILLFFIYINGFSDSAKPAVAVIDFQAKEGVTKELSSTLTDYFRSKLFQLEKYLLVTRNDMSLILKEQNFQLSGCTSEECVVQAGKILGVEKIITGSLGMVGDLYVVNIKMIRVSSGIVEIVDSVQVKGQEMILKALDLLAREMSGEDVSKELNELKKSVIIGGYFNVNRKRMKKYDFELLWDFYSFPNDSYIDLIFQNLNYLIFLQDVFPTSISYSAHQIHIYYSSFTTKFPFKFNLYRNYLNRTNKFIFSTGLLFSFNRVSHKAMYIHTTSDINNLYIPSDYIRLSIISFIPQIRLVYNISNRLSLNLCAGAGAELFIWSAKYIKHEDENGNLISPTKGVNLGYSIFLKSGFSFKFYKDYSIKIGFETYYKTFKFKRNISSEEDRFEMQGPNLFMGVGF